MCMTLWRITEEIKLMPDRLTKYYWWPNMYGDNESYTRDVSFDIGDMVYLDARNLGSSHFVHSARKLRERYIGPF